MSELKQSLDKFIRQSSTIVIRYNGGSRPGEERAVVPISLSEEELVAREVGQRQAKQFKLAKIASARLVDGDAVSNPDAVALSFAPEYETFEEYVPLFEDLAAEKQWHVVRQENYFGICAFFKNGKPRSTPSVSIQFIDRSSQTVIDVFTGEVSDEKYEPTGRERPWRVDSKRMGDGKAYALLPRVAERFMEELRAANHAQSDA
jgi:hypothetical protein